MKRFLTATDLVNWLGMQRVVDARAFVVLEGPTDCQALESVIDGTSAMTVPGHAKTIVLEAIELSEARQMPHVLGIVDRDLDGVLQPECVSDNVVYTDDYDLEATMLFAGTVFDRVVANMSDREVRERHLAEVSSSANELVIDIAGAVGLLRYASARDGHGLRCRKLPVHAVVNANGHAIDVHQLARVAISRSPNSTVAEGTVVTVVQEEQKTCQDLRRFCNGHDLAATLAMLARRWGSARSQVAIEENIRVAFGCAELKETNLYVAIQAWCERFGAAVWNCA